MSQEWVKVLAMDIGKSQFKVVQIEVAKANDGSGKPRTHAFKKIAYHNFKRVPSLASTDAAARVIREVTKKCGATLTGNRLAITFPLPIEDDGRIQNRENFEFLGGKTVCKVEEELRTELGVESLSLYHDSQAQMKYVLNVYSPKEVFAILACGTSFAFTMASPEHPGVFEGMTSTFSHMVLGGNGPKCKTCGDKCLGAWYKDLWEKKRRTLPAICRAVSVARRLPISVLFVAGGALGKKTVRTAVEKQPLRLSTARVEIVKDPKFSGAIGAALDAAST